MSFFSEQEAMALPCPVARIQGDADKDGNTKAKCRGRECLVWRWRNDAADPFFKSAVLRETANIKLEAPDTKNIRTVAAQRVAANPDGFVSKGESRTGYCGLGGKV